MAPGSWPDVASSPRNLLLLTKVVESVLARPSRWLTGILVATLLPLVGLCLLEFRTDGAAIYPTDDATVLRTEADRILFQDDDLVIVLITAAAGQDLATRAGLEHLKRLHDSVAKVAGVARGRLRSVASLLDPQPGKALLLLPDFLDEIPREESEFRALVRRIRGFPPTDGLFLSPDGSAAAIYVPVHREHTREELLSNLESWAARHRSAAFDLQLTGPVTAEVMLGRTVLRDLAWLVPIMIAVIAVLLFLSLRSLGGVLVTLAEVGTVLVWTIGTMGLFSVPITLVTVILPIVLMSMAVTDEIHLLDALRRRLAEGAPRPDALRRAIRDVARPIVLTSLTTSIGFLSFLAVTTAPIREFGVFTALGVVLAMALSFTLVPALVLLLPKTWFRPWKPCADNRALPVHERLVSRSGGRVAVVGLVVFLLAAPGALLLSVKDSWVENFDTDSQVVSAERAFNREFWGSYRFDVVLQKEELSYFQLQHGLGLIQKIVAVAEAAPHVGGVISPLLAYETLAVIRKEKRPIPEFPLEVARDYAKVVQTMQVRVDLDQYLIGNGKDAKVRLFVKNADFERTRELEAYLERELPPVLRGTGVSFHFSGDLPVAQAVVGGIVSNMLLSVSWTVIGVALLLAFALRSVGSAIVCLLPLLAGIPLLLGVIGYAGMPLGIATSMFVAVTIGTAVDFGLHFSHAYRRARATGVEHLDAIESTFRGTGRAIRWNATVLTLGLLVLTLSAMKPNRSLGLLLAGAMATCYAMMVMLLPVMLRYTAARQRD